ncbi:hypothetical protein Q7L71_26785, partial [Conexibacter sp. CPCC 205706]|nr:hypothetical protein [Conexibacter sp. CPCC 205706]
MTISPDELPARLRALPAAAPLFDVLAGDSRLHVVGGAVRDLLLGGLPLDLDLVVEGDAAELAARLAEGLGGELLVHDRFGTATVTAGARSYDLVRARAETYARPGALPEVRPGTLAQDLARRDFTINAIALTLAGRLDAVAHALDDLAEGELRVLHAQSFLDDPTRLLRLVRYATRLGFGVERETARLAGEAVAGGALATVTATRIGRELRLLLREPAAADALAWVCGWGDGDALVPGLGFDAELAASARALMAGGAAGEAGGAPGAGGGSSRDDGRDDLLLLAVATRGVGRRLGAWLDALGFAARERDAVVAAAQRSGRVAQRLRAAEGRASAIAAALDGAGPELAALAGALGGAEK